MFIRLIYLAGLLMLSACAIISSPTGGDKDETPPAIINTFPPNQQPNFTAESIDIWFDEYIELKDFTGQFYSSPPLDKPITPKLKGKKLTLFLDEELKDSTTYTFSFGSCLQDITEGNIQGDFKYVFSTGSTIDSLSIVGTVVDAYTGKPLESMIAVLYPVGVDDTIILQERPIYYSITDENGLFAIENLAEEEYQLFAVQDDNLNLRYDSGEEQYGFLSQPIHSQDSLPVRIRAFKDERQLQFEGAKYAGFGKVLLSFSQPVKDAQVRLIPGDDIPQLEPQNVLESDKGGDTLYYWFDRNIFPEDLSFLYLNVAFTDTVIDSVRVSLKEVRAPKLSFEASHDGALSPADSLLLASNMPILEVDNAHVLVTKNADTVDAQIQQTSGRMLHLPSDLRYGDKFGVTFFPGAISTLFGPNEDTINTTLKLASEDELAILILALTSEDDTHKIYQLFDLKSKTIISENVFTNEVSLQLVDLVPQKYGIRIIWDDNGNGRWDVGEFATRKQPEQIRYYPNEIELRANWELEIDWDIPTLKK